MPRKHRLFLPNTPQHIVVRGHNRSPVLARHEDFQYMYRCLLDAASQNQLAVHAWVFMHNHLHILATPTHPQSAGKTMQSIGRRYAQYFNKHYGRSGALWEGRYKAALVDTEHYLLSCYRYIELNPVRAGLAKRPENYPYSSYHYNALGKADKLVSPHEVYLAVCNVHQGSESADSAPPTVATPDRSHYHQLFKQALSPKDITAIQRGTNKNASIGSNQFKLKIAELLV